MQLELWHVIIAAVAALGVGLVIGLAIRKQTGRKKEQEAEQRAQMILKDA